MSIKIRLSKVGRKNLPAYRIIATNTRDKRDGKYLDLIGHYNPSMSPESFEYDKKKYGEWISKGAQVTDAVKKLIKGNYKYTPYKGTQDEGPKGIDHSSRGEVDEKKAEPAPADATTDKKTEENIEEAEEKSSEE
jgi:small subunit ribosomal protein S16